jgi:hypothetical protein
MSNDSVHCLHVRQSPGNEPELFGKPVPRSAAVDTPVPISEAQIVAAAPRAIPTRFPLLIDVRTRLRHRRGMPSPVAIIRPHVSNGYLADGAHSWEGHVLCPSV